MIDLEKPNMKEATLTDRYLYRLVEQLQYALDMLETSAAQGQTEQTTTIARSDLDRASVGADSGYVVYKNGLKIAWAKKTFTGLNVNAQWGSLYKAEPLDLGELPLTFAAPPIVQVRWQSAYLGWAFCLKEASTTSWGKTGLVMPEISTDVSGTFYLLAVGE